MGESPEDGRLKAPQGGLKRIQIRGRGGGEEFKQLGQAGEAVQEGEGQHGLAEGGIEMGC